MEEKYRCRKCGKTEEQGGLHDSNGFTCRVCIENLTVGEIVAKVNELRTIEKEVVKTKLEEDNFQKWLELVAKFGTVKKDIKCLMLDLPIAQIPDRTIRDTINDLYQEEKSVLYANRALLVLKKMGYDFDGLGGDEIEDLASDLFYSWFCGSDYVQNLFEISSVKIGIRIKQDDFLRIFISAARESYALKNYVALYSLCRTIIEAATRDICTRKKYFRKDVTELKEYSISGLIKAASGRNSNLKDRMDSIHDKTSPLIHGRKKITSQEAMTLYRETMEAIEDLYAYHFKD